MAEDFKKDFYIESIEILEKANEDILKAESEDDKSSLINSVFRGIHTVKGGAGMFELPDISSFAHELEGVLNILRDGLANLNSNYIDVIMGGIDHLIKLFKDCLTDTKIEINNSLVDHFRAICKDPSIVADDEMIVKDEIKPEADLEKAKITKEPEIQTMRVNESKVEQFTNIVGELLIAKNTYDYLFHKLHDNELTIESSIKLFKDNLYQFSRLTNEIHHGVISLRMIPIRGIFTKFQRIIRDISRKQKKPIIMKTFGDDIEIDKKIADIISDPMVHLIRNSCDHGIELPDERIKAGKNVEGTVTLKASQEGSILIIKIIDDGKGINRKKVYEKAKKLKLETPAPDDDAILDLIFMPGFSTKSVVSDISGRGVGMDVVKTTIQSLGGNVEIQSQQGKGSEITLSIPMTMGINPSLIIKCHGNFYAIPLDYIIETMKINPKRIRKAGDNLIFYYRQEVLAVYELEQILDSAFIENKYNYIAQKEISIVVMQTRQGKFGVIVEGFYRNMDVAIKPLPEVLNDVDVISGASIMGDGKVFLVLNPEKF